MKNAIKKTLLLSLLVALGLALCPTPAWAEDTGYGAKNPVSTVKEARSALENYFKGKDVKIGNIEEKELFFEAEILNKGGNLVDRVIIDKRTGRIRSIY